MSCNTLIIKVKSSVGEGKICLHNHLHLCLCRGRQIVCASQKKMYREAEKSVALTENPLPLCRNVRVAQLFLLRAVCGMAAVQTSADWCRWGADGCRRSADAFGSYLHYTIS